MKEQTTKENDLNQKEISDKQALAQRVLGEISQHHVEPTPRWVFVMRNLALWGSGLILIVVGALSVSHIIFILSGDAWEMQRILGYSTPSYFISFFPFLWLVSFILFFTIAQYALKHTRRAYKYSPFIVACALIVLSAILGALFYSLKISDVLDRVLSQKAPRFYETKEQRIDHFIHKPQKGHIMGLVISIQDDSCLIKNPRNQDEITVMIEKLTPQSLELIQVDQKIIFIGKPLEKGFFEATQALKSRGDIKPSPFRDKSKDQMQIVPPKRLEPLPL